MNKLELMYEFASENDINIVNAHFSVTKKAACLHWDESKNIILDKPVIRTDSEELTLLAEEVGHYETGTLFLVESTANSPIARSNQIWGEGKSKNWACRRLVTIDELQDAIDEGIVLYIDFAERFGVDVEVIHRAFKIYEGQLVPKNREWNDI